MDDRSFGLGDRGRYHAQIMPRFSLKPMFLLIAILALALLPLSIFVRHSINWGPAERTATMLAELYRDSFQHGNTEFTLDVINDLLETPKFEFLNQHRTFEIELRDRELAWFSPNAQYSIGINENGEKLWTINGKRENE